MRWTTLFTTLLLAGLLTISASSKPDPEAPTLLSRHWQSVVSRLQRGQLPHCPYFVDGTLMERFSLEDVRRGQLFTMFIEGAQAEDALLAAGVALAKGIPSVYIVQQRDRLPWFLREADQTYPGLVAIVEGSPGELPDLKPGASYKKDPGQRFDNFIGCIMSGLTAHQYSQGQTQLRAIDQALSRHFGESNNFCEGLNVANPSTFGTPRQSLEVDLRSLKASRRAIFFVYDNTPRPSGMWVELGAALAWNKPCLLLVPRPGQDCQPPALSHGLLPGNLRQVEYLDHESLMQTWSDGSGTRTLLRP